MRDDGGDWLGPNAFTAALSQPYTAFAVAQLAPAAVNDNNYHFILDGDDTTNRLVLLQRADNTPDAWALNAGVGLVGGNSNGNWNIWTVLANGVTSQFWHNGISQVSGNAGAHNADGLTIGSHPTGTLGWIGDISEILIYDPNLSTADMNQVAQYIAAKTAIVYTPIV